ncbi:hypothetical protein DFQ28_003823 [Apophysomyces sp. BC1034]|nr:hypothetical protein DFQ29_002516 [Apophysomyces sp. BC1021]KAG0189124.1 hypothetical protein DFQ28_003823 [Apophysomyces sp. BC1034]
MALYIGNPTNVIVSEAYGISFAKYSAWMLLPTVVCLLLAYVTLRILFHQKLPQHLQPPDTDPRSVLIDSRGAVLRLLLLGFCLATLIGTSFAGVPVWMVTLPYAVITLIRDVCYDIEERCRAQTRRRHSDDNMRIPEIPLANIQNSTTSSIRSTAIGTINNEADANVSVPTSIDRILKHIRQTTRWAKIRDRLQDSIGWVTTQLPTASAVIRRLPWTILPFTLGMFVLVEALSDTGWVSIFATGLSVITRNYITAVYGMAAISIVACQLLNNLPMTILFTRIIQHPHFVTHVHSDVVMQGVLLGLIMGSNIAACGTLVGSLAGIM